MVFPLMLGDVVRESDMGALLAEPKRPAKWQRLARWWAADNTRNLLDTRPHIDLDSSVRHFGKPG
jgi:hypothetical protein